MGIEPTTPCLQSRVIWTPADPDGTFGLVTANWTTATNRSGWPWMCHGSAMALTERTPRAQAITRAFPPPRLTEQQCPGLDGHASLTVMRAEPNPAGEPRIYEYLPWSGNLSRQVALRPSIAGPEREPTVRLGREENGRDASGPNCWGHASGGQWISVRRVSPVLLDSNVAPAARLRMFRRVTRLGLRRGG